MTKSLRPAKQVVSEYQARRDADKQAQKDRVMTMLVIAVDTGLDRGEINLRLDKHDEAVARELLDAEGYVYEVVENANPDNTTTTIKINLRTYVKGWDQPYS